MPRKSKSVHPLRELRRTIALSQAGLAKLIGVATSTVKHIENGDLTISHELAARVFLATGFMVMETPAGPQGLTWTGEQCTRESFDLWKAELETSSAVASALTAQLVGLVEILMLASARPAVGKTVQVFHALLQMLNSIADQFELQQPIDAHLTERHSTETQLYRVGDLRENSLLAEMVGFRDNPDLKDGDRIPLTKPIGWLQHREIFNVLWNHREILTRLVSAKDTSSDLLVNLTEKLAEVEKQLEAIF